MTKTMHMCLCVRGAMRWPNNKLKKMFRDKETGKFLTADECKEYLMQKLSEGWEVLPIGQICEGFDKINGCPGHDVTEGGTQ